MPDDLLYSCWTTIKGFSFACKKWGELAVDHVHKIEYDDKA